MDKLQFLVLIRCISQYPKQWQISTALLVKQLVDFDDIQKLELSPSVHELCQIRTFI